MSNLEEGESHVLGNDCKLVCFCAATIDSMQDLHALDCMLYSWHEQWPCPTPMMMLSLSADVDHLVRNGG